MSELPTGTVTFVFTDIEGSTRLIQELGERFLVVLEEHAGVVRQAVSEFGGIEVNTEGDSFFLVFRSPADAVLAAVTTQRRLAAHDWSEDAQVRVRMGIHTGEGVLGGNDYVGIDVNRAARISGAAHGGQVLLSGATRGLVEHALPQGTDLRVLGPHRFKDLAHPEDLYQLVIEDLPSDFPPPKTLDARPNNLPQQLTSFVGREGEIAKVRHLLSHTRLLTLTGMGGPERLGSPCRWRPRFSPSTGMEPSLSISPRLPIRPLSPRPSPRPSRFGRRRSDPSSKP